MLLYFLRHAEAEDTADTDFNRRLTEKGQAQAAKVARFFQRHEFVPSVILTSPVTRAKQTAHAISDALEVDLVKLDWLACGMEPSGCLDGVRPYEHHASILLVGHEPDFSSALTYLLGLKSPQALHIRKASLTAITLPALQAGAGELEFSIPVRLM